MPYLKIQFLINCIPKENSKSMPVIHMTTALAKCGNCIVANQSSVCVEKVSYNMMFFCLISPSVKNPRKKNGTWHPEPGTDFTTTS